MIALVLALVAASIPPIQLRRTETQRAGSPPFDLLPNDTGDEEIAACRVEETLPMGSGTAEKRSCHGRLDPDSARRRCQDATRHNALPQGVTGESCVEDYQRGRFLFPGELKEVIVTRRRDGTRVAAFEILEGDLVTAFQHVGDAVLIGIGGGDRVHYAVVGTKGILPAPRLGDDPLDVDVAGGRIRVTGRRGVVRAYLVPRDGRLHLEKK